MLSRSLRMPAGCFRRTRSGRRQLTPVGRLEQTGRRWGIGRFDLLQVHNLVDWQANLELLFALKERGQLGHVGITTSHGRRHGDLERIMATQPVDFVQLTYNLADRGSRSTPAAGWRTKRALPSLSTVHSGVGP